MADGTWPHAAPTGGPRLALAASGRNSLWAVCGCGNEAALDAGHWLGQGLASHPLRELEHRLRCGCGARRARLEVRGLAEAPAAGSGGIYVFR